jgi:non-ribosomal peptide synthase protein (TIGR01720 family)
LGYGVLKYLHTISNLQGKDSWDLVFNYLGQTDNVLREEGLLGGAAEGTGNNRAGSLHRNSLLEINSIISSGELQVDWSYSNLHYEASTVNQLAARYIEVLLELVSHCRSAGAVDSRIPADYGLSGDVSYEELDNFLNRTGPEMDNIMSF